MEVRCLSAWRLSLPVNIVKALHKLCNQWLLVSGSPGRHYPVTANDIKKLICGSRFWLVSSQGEGDGALVVSVFLWVVGE